MVGSGVGGGRDGERGDSGSGVGEKEKEEGEMAENVIRDDEREEG